MEKAVAMEEQVKGVAWALALVREWALVLAQNNPACTKSQMWAQWRWA